MCGWLLLLLWGLLPGVVAGGLDRALPHRTLLDSEGKYWLSWGPRGGRLAFRLEVRTAGYVGFGFSPTGAMAAADIVVGGVAHGRPYLQVSASPPGARPAELRPVSRPRGRRECRRSRGRPVNSAAGAGSRRYPEPCSPNPARAPLGGRLPLPRSQRRPPLGSAPPPPGPEFSPGEAEHG